MKFITGIIRTIGLLLLILSVFSNCKKKTTDPVAASIDTMDYDQNESVLIAAGWTKIFNEDFNSNLNQWVIWKGGAYNNEYEYYSDSSANLSISNGVLVINAKKDSVTGATTNTNSAPKSFGFTSARIESSTFFSANTDTANVRFSARIKLPSGFGMWPAFWTYGNNWPTNGEIDIIEARGNLPLQYSTNYFYGTQPNVSLVSNTSATLITSTKSLTDYWHVYEAIWANDSLTYFLDGKVIDVKKGTYIGSMFGKSQKIALNLAVGGAYFNNPAPSTIVTGTMYVDWVRVFKF